MRDLYTLDKTHQAFYSFQDGKGFEFVLRRPNIWVPSSAANEKSIPARHFRSGGSRTASRHQRRRIPLEERGKVRIGYLKEIAINRRNLLTYVANKLGGIHYDSKRLPMDREDATQFTVLATAYDWDNQAIMHAGLVAVAMACIELLNTPEIVGLVLALQTFHAERHQRLSRFSKLPSFRRRDRFWLRADPSLLRLP